MNSDSPKSNKIPTTPPSDTSQDFYALRSLGLKLISKMGTDIWTDFNAHDPGITILETVAYAITDLGYRTQFPISDLIAQANLSVEAQQENLRNTAIHTAGDMLPSAPTTINDFRKIFIDIEGVSNAWVQKVNRFQPYKGLRKVVIQPTVPNLAEKPKKALKKAVKQAFWSNRNLGEALHKIQILKPRELALDLQLVIADGEVPEKVVAAAIIELSNFLEGRVHFLTLNQMLLACAHDVAQAFEGPKLKHGFLPDANLAPKIDAVDPDQLIRSLRNLPGITSIIGIQVLIAAVTKWAGSPYERVGGNGKLKILPNEFPVFAALDKFQFVVFQRQRPYALNAQVLEEEVAHLRSMQMGTKRAKGGQQDLPIPIGKFRDPQQYYSIQYDFPSIYNLRPGTMSYLQDGDPRQGETNQLRGYLLLFDQILTNYLAQLGNIGQLFSWSSDVTRTYFVQGLEGALENLLQLLVGLPDNDIPSPLLPENAKKEFQATLLDGLAIFKAQMAKLKESQAEFLVRRTKFLDHLLARFGLNLQEFVAQLPTGDPETMPDAYISTAQNLLANYPILSRKRGTGDNPLIKLDTSESGVQAWIESILDIQAIDRNANTVYEKVSILGRKPIKAQPMLGKFLLTTNDGSPINLPDVIRLGQNPNNFRIVEAEIEAGGYTIKLYGDVETGAAGGMYGFANTFLSVKAAMEAIDQVVATLSAFSVAAERFYMIDHILLRPFPDNPVHGLEVFDLSGELFMQTVNWYPLPALKRIVQIQQNNTWIVNFPTLDRDAFVFQVFAFRGSNPYPVYEKQLALVPNDFAPTSTTIFAPEVNSLFQSYILDFYPETFDQGTNLGTALSSDFLNADLPNDFVASGKADRMEAWGNYALGDIFQRWEAVVGTGNLGVAILAVIKGNGTFSSQIPDPLDQNLLAQYANQFYIDKFPTAPELEAAMQQDLKNGLPTESESILDARKYLANVGRMLGTAYVQAYFGPSPISPNRIGNGIAVNLNLVNPVGIDPSLLNALSTAFLTANSSLDPASQGPAFISKLLKAKIVSDISTSQNFLDAMTRSARTLWGTWLRAYWPVETASSQYSSLGNAVSAWLETLSSGIAPTYQTPLTFETTKAITTWLQAAATRFPNDPTQFGKWIATNLLGSAAVLPQDESTFQAAILADMQGYASIVLATTDANSTDPVATNLVQQLGLTLPCTDKSLWDSGAKALAYFIDATLISPSNPNQLPAPEVLGQSLIDAFGKDVLPSTSTVQPLNAPFSYVPSDLNAASDALAIIGAYTLSAYIQTYVLPQTPKGGTPGEIFLDDPKSPNSGKTEAKLNAEIASASTTVTDLLTGKISSPQLIEVLSEGNLDHLLVQESAFTLDTINPLLTTLQSPQKPEDFGDLLPKMKTAGYIFMVNFLQSRWKWQWDDATALGNAVLALWPQPVPSPPNPIKRPPYVAPAPVNYAFQLHYFGAQGIPVEMHSMQAYSDYEAVLTAISGFQKNVAAIHSGKLSFSKIFKTILQPEGLPIERIKSKYILENPYSNIVTVLAPNWPLRFQENGFKDRAEQLIRASMPAHLYPLILWLSKQEMQVFEEVYFPWMDEDLDDIARDFYGRQLMRLILQKAMEPLPLMKIYPAQNGAKA